MTRQNFLHSKKNLNMRVFLILIVLLFSVGNSTLIAQPPPPEDYKVVNKTSCTVEATAHCSNGSSTSATLIPDQILSNSSPTGAYLCWAEIEFPSSTVAYFSSSSFCLNPGANLPADTCYTSGCQWDEGSFTYVLCNFY